jgi:hypothetical protein
MHDLQAWQFKGNYIDSDIILLDTTEAPSAATLVG